MSTEVSNQMGADDAEEIAKILTRCKWELRKALALANDCQDYRIVSLVSNFMAEAGETADRLNRHYKRG